jgi:uncharacterized protein YfiM (DUF2279 family)
MPIQVISGTTPANTGQLATPATTNFSIEFVSGSYADTYVSSSATASLREAAITAFSVEGIKVVFYSGSTDPVNTADTIFINDVPFATSAANFTATASAVFNASASAANSATAYSSLQGITSAVSASTGLLFSIGATGSYDNAYNLNTQYTAVSGSTTLTFSGASMFGPAGSGKVTGSFTQILATADAQVIVSGSVLGEAAFTLPRGTAYTPSGSGLIQAITVVNPQGTVVAS